MPSSFTYYYSLLLLLFYSSSMLSLLDYLPYLTLILTECSVKLYPLFYIFLLYSYYAAAFAISPFLFLNFIRGLLESSTIPLLLVIAANSYLFLGLLFSNSSMASFFVSHFSLMSLISKRSTRSPLLLLILLESVRIFLSIKS